MPIRSLNSFKVRSGNRSFDYRLGQQLDLSEVRLFFQKNYGVEDIWSGPRHIFARLIQDEKVFFLKLATSEGINIVTKNEYSWNNYFNQNAPLNISFAVPKNHDSGLFKKKYFYLITNYFDGQLLCPLRALIKSDRLTSCIPRIIKLSELIQEMPFAGKDYHLKFIEKANKWFYDIPIDVRKEFEIEELLNTVLNETDDLVGKPRHGDFAPWHMIDIVDTRLGLVDGEHAQTDGVEYYDICYFIQRVFSVLKNPEIAQEIYLKLLKKGYKSSKLKTVLASRAIGGFLDESLNNKPDYKFANKFKEWVIQN